MSTVKEELMRSGNIMFPNKGVSMMPLIRQGKDLMIIEKRNKTRFKKHDVVLFERLNGALVLHRISDVLDDGYMILGDNCINKEYVKEESVLGIMTGLLRNGKRLKLDSVGYKTYVKFWTGIYPLRRILMKLKAKLS